MDEKEQAFQEWMAEVDEVVGETIGLTTADLPDCLWRDWFDSGRPPQAAAAQALEDAGFSPEW
ncbi:MAG: hypothetical protein KA314_04820 [Chloroflexi bacterium]|nr:hypothetical protein [Chloroflexota bacterium]